ncbi:MAG: toprim domain-containing protein [Myxococcales bacterium]|nr:toprim domain-containing protein [Myxococcales bacterium]
MIGQETIDRVRAHTAIVALVGETVKLQKRGRSFTGLCPFHKEKTASFHVNEERGFYHCFGCGAHGDAFRFLMELEGLSFVEAIRRLAERAGITIVEHHDERERKAEVEARRRQEELYAVGNVAAEFFERMLREHSLGRHAERELEKRELRADDPTGPIADALQAFRIGYAPYGWDALASHLRDAGMSHLAAEQVGLLVPRKSGSGHYDRFRHRLMFAVLDLQGRVIAFSGRALPDPEDAELRSLGVERIGGGAPAEPPAKYVNSPESPIYKKREAVFGLYQAKSAIRDCGVAVLVEGNFDVMSLHARGIKNVVAPLGTAFTAEQARLVKRFAPNVTLLFDGDSAGRRAVIASRDSCKQSGLMAKVATLPQGTDPDELVREHGAEAIRRVVGAARGMLEYLIDTALDSFSGTDAHARAAKLKEITELLAAEDDPAVRALAEQHADRVAAHLGMGDDRTFRALRSSVLAGMRSGEASPPPRAAAPDRARSTAGRAEIEQVIFGALLDYPALLGDDEVLAGVDLVEGDVAGGVAALRQACQDGELQNPELILAKLGPSIHPFASARLAAPRHERLEDARLELLQNVEKLKRLELKRRRSEVVAELQRAASVGDVDQEMALLREHMRRTRERHGL